MILNDQVAASVPRFCMLTVFLLAGTVLPAWSIGGDYLQPNSSRQSTAVATAGESRANNGVSGRIFVGAWFRDAEAEDESSMPIIAVDPATGEWRKVAGGGQMPVVSPDGNPLAFQRYD